MSCCYFDQLFMQNYIFRIEILIIVINYKHRNIGVNP